METVQATARKGYVYVFLVMRWLQNSLLILETLKPKAMERWIAAMVLLLLYIVRVVWIGGYYIISYGLGIYILNGLLGFLTPRFNQEEDLPGLPTTESDEFKPFVRRLPEYQFWFGVVKALLLSICFTFFRFLDIPVYWPILLIYFIFLFLYTMQERIKHMIKHRYIPFSLGKPTFTSDANSK